MKQEDKLKEALKLLQSVSNNWIEEDCVDYPKSLPSFDELVAEMKKIHISTNSFKPCRVEENHD